MSLLKLFRSTDNLWKLLLGSVVAIAPAFVPVVAHAQNQSDVTGPNMSDITGTNQSDNTGTNQSDNTGILGEAIFRGVNGDLVTFVDYFQNFFDTYGEELDLDPEDDLQANLNKARQACASESTGGVRRFSRTPGPSVPPVSAACNEFNQLVAEAREVVAEYRQARGGATPINQRVW
ncbi:hypothetical protein [Leptothoe kymatousa]|uniref:Uncharacterized protein n=1 Tax=Leptothoe kymatousa TAU-MAC 1615 TaxID=2364775 RepID=A0ABS5Y4D6_9CYAN|nr:hypothetical protein [Leptothoe kymatousa]MBT9312481.1 hypothetical protein [Leptothoe kymatousa TAU-MAC 1615]